MRFDVISLFPQTFSAVTQLGVTGRAHEKGLWQFSCWNPRDYTTDTHRTVDDRPYGGGPGMVMLAEPLEKALTDALIARRSGQVQTPHSHQQPPQTQSRQAQSSQASIIQKQTTRAQLQLTTTASANSELPVVLLSPAGRPFTQSVAQQWAEGGGAVLICGRYEGIDQRFIDTHITHEYSLGDFVMSGGEFAALAMIDTTVRLLPGVLNHEHSALADSFHEGLDGLLDSPHYTRPEVDAQQRAVPAVLRSGDHQAIARWRRQQSLLLSSMRRPDLIVAARQKGLLGDDDERFLALLQEQGARTLLELLRDAPISLPRRGRR